MSTALPTSLPVSPGTVSADPVSQDGDTVEIATPSSLRTINPVISTEAVGELDAVIPNTAAATVDENDTGAMERASVDLLRSVKVRPWTVLRTAIPLAVADLVALLLTFLFATTVMLAVTDWIVPHTFIYQFAVLGVIYFAVASVFRLYPGSGVSPPAEMRSQVTAVALSFLILLTMNGFFGRLSKSEAVSVISGGLLSLIIMPVTRFVAREFLGRQSWWGERAILVGAGRQSEQIASFLRKTPQRGLRPVGLVDAPHRYWRDEDAKEALPYIGSPDQLTELAEEHDATWAIIPIGGRDPEEVAELMTRGSMMPNLLVLPSRTALPSLWTTSRECGGLTGLHIQDRLLNPLPRAIKRAIDMAVSGVALLALSPFFLVATVMIKTISPGPVFYGHMRVGRSGQRFKMWKFRSMVPNADRVLADVLAGDPALAEEWERDQKLKNDPRIIRGIGTFLRKTSLDEIPQLWNVLLGQMSLVGPRPLPLDEVAKYERSTYPLYLRVRPGITGLWQVSGRNNTTYEDRMRLNTYYVRNWSPWLDLYLLLRTVRTMVFREGAY